MPLELLQLENWRTRAPASSIVPVRLTFINTCHYVPIRAFCVFLFRFYASSRLKQNKLSGFEKLLKVNC